LCSGDSDLWWKIIVVKVIKIKKKSTKRIQESAKKNQRKIAKQSVKRSTLESLLAFVFWMLCWL